MFAIKDAYADLIAPLPLDHICVTYLDSDCPKGANIWGQGGDLYVGGAASWAELAAAAESIPLDLEMKSLTDMGFMTTICSAWPWLSQSEPDCLCENGFVNKLIRTRMVRIFRLWWSIGDSNPGPQRCERCALPTVLISQMYEADSIQEKCCYSIVEYGLYSFWNLCFVLSGIQTALKASRS